MSTSRPKTRAQGRRPSRATQRAKKGGTGKSGAKRLGIAALAAGLLGAIAFFIAYATTDTPQPNDLADAQASIVYYADGKTEMDRHQRGQPRVGAAVEGARGRAEGAARGGGPQLLHELRHLARPASPGRSGSALRGGQTQGGSTITQQYVKNYFLTQDQHADAARRKEILISIKIDKQQSKDQILENYLNTIYYGRGAYGIQTASKAYFNKDVSKLTASEGALLASVIRGPSLYDPGLGAKQKANAEGRVGPTSSTAWSTRAG